MRISSLQAIINWLFPIYYYWDTNYLLCIIMYSVATTFRLELLEPSARELFIFWTLVEREERWASEERRNEHGSNLAGLV